MQVTFWGVRGSMPTPGPSTFKYGGNTPCLEIGTPEGHTIIFDCGTGITHLGKLLTEKTTTNDGQHLMVFLTHFHWDHIQGLPFFAPLYDARNQVSFHCFEAQGMSPKDALGGPTLTPYFPVSRDLIKSQKHFHIIGEARMKMFDVEIVSRYLNHPQGCLGFRIEAETGVFVYATDHEQGNPDLDASVRKLAEGADLLVYDGQYTPAEYESRGGWGHSTWEEGIHIAHDAGVKELVLFHHDPDHSDAFLDRMLLEARAYFPRLHAAMEGTTVNIKRQEAGGAFRSCMERRYCERLELARPLGVRLKRIGHHAETERTLLRDLSLDGSSFLVDHDWDIGTEVDVKIEAPIDRGTPTSMLHLRGKVARSEKVEGKTRIGVSFHGRLSTPE